jgi:hypothetical protein
MQNSSNSYFVDCPEEYTTHTDWNQIVIWLYLAWSSSLAGGTSFHDKYFMILKSYDCKLKGEFMITEHEGRHSSGGGCQWLMTRYVQDQIKPLFTRMH